MSRNNAVTTPEGPGQGQSSTDITSPNNTIHDVFNPNQFLQYPMYPPIYHYPLTQPITSLLPLPPSLPTQRINQSQSNINNKKPNSNSINHTHNHNHNHNRSKKNYKKNNKQTHNNTNKTDRPIQIQKTKPKTVDLSRNNSRGELETLVRWIGGDSIAIKHHCSHNQLNNEWHCVCILPLPFQTSSTSNNNCNASNILQTKSKHSKKKDAIKIASKLMIKEILKQPLPISIDIINTDGNITSLEAKLNKNSIIQINKNNNIININKGNENGINDNISHQSSDDDDYCSIDSINKVNISIKKKHIQKQTHGNTPSGSDHKKNKKNHRERCSYTQPSGPPPPYDYDAYYGPPPIPPYTHHPHAYYHSDWYRASYPPVPPPGPPPRPWSNYTPYYPPPAAHGHGHEMRYYNGQHGRRDSTYNSKRVKKKKQVEETEAVEEQDDIVATDDEESMTDEHSTLKSDMDVKEDENINIEYLSENNDDDENEIETDDGIINIGITPKGNDIHASNSEVDDEYMNELKEEEISLKKCEKNKKDIIVKDDSKVKESNNTKSEKEGINVSVPPQRLLVLVPSYVEYKMIESILPSNCEIKIFSKKFNIIGVIIPSFDTESPGEQNRLYIIHCGTGLINVSLAIGIVCETVGIDAVLLLGHAISLKPKSIKPGHLLLPNNIIQHDLCSENNNAIFKINNKLSSWIKCLINKRSEKENETLPVMYEGVLLSGSEIIKSEKRISYLVKTYTQQKNNNNSNSNSNNGKDNVMAVDRESISVAIICRMLKIPFVVLKSIAPPKFDDNQINFESYDDTCSNNAVFDCNASIPLVRALLKEYTMLDY